MIPALVLTAGLATRLRPLSRLRAKASLPVAGTPLIARILTHLAAAGIGDVVLNLHHQPHTITDIVGDGTALGVRARYSWENPVLGSAGGPKRAIPLLASPEFLIVNGDTLTDVDLSALVEQHRQSGALVTMALVQNVEPWKYGGVVIDEEGVVTGFARRRDPRQPAADPARAFHFIGAQVVSASAFADVPADVPFESVGSLYPSLLSRVPGSIRGFVTGAEFLDVGTPADYLNACLRLARREGRPSAGDNVIWDRVTIDPAARVERSILTDDVTVPAGVTWSNVTVRRMTGPLEPNETLVDGLAVASLNPGARDS